MPQQPMVVFEDQTAFEDAVMEVIKERLSIGVSVSRGYHDYQDHKSTRVEVSLKDSATYQEFNSAQDNA